MRHPSVSPCERKQSPIGIGRGKDLSLIRPPGMSPEREISPEVPYLDIASRVKEKKRECAKRNSIKISDVLDEDEDNEDFKDDSLSDPDFVVEHEKGSRSEEELDENVELYLEERPRKGRRSHRRDSNGQRALANNYSMNEPSVLTAQPVPSSSSNAEFNYSFEVPLPHVPNKEYGYEALKKPEFLSPFDLQDNPRIPRPPNAFMIFANEWRKHIARIYPSDSNKTISVRLGRHWKVLKPENKAVYYSKAQKISALHSLRYPNYTYNPKEARVRKAQRDALKTSSRNAANQVLHSFSQMGSATPNSANYHSSYSSPNLASGASISGGGIIGGTSGSRSQPGPPSIRNRQPTYPGTTPAYSNLEHQRDFSLSQYAENSYGYYGNVPSGPSTTEPHNDTLFGHGDAPHYSNNSVWGESSSSQNPMIWQAPPPSYMRQERGNMDYGNFSTSDPVPMPTSQSSLLSNNGSLDCNPSFDFSASEPMKISKYDEEIRKRVLDLIISNEFLNRHESSNRYLEMCRPEMFNLPMPNANAASLNDFLTTSKMHLIADTSQLETTRQFVAGQNKIFTSMIHSEFLQRVKISSSKTNDVIEIIDITTDDK